MVPELTRRRLLVGLGVVGAGGSLAAIPRTWYPDRVVDRMIGRRDLPGTDTQPAVPDGLLEDGLAELEPYLAGAERLWDEINDDRDDLPDGARLGRSHLGTARDLVDELETADDDRDRTFDLQRAYGDVGYAIGAGRLALEKTDAEGLVEQGEEIRSETDDLVRAIEYRGEPLTATATLYWIERTLLLARLNSHRNGSYTGGVAPPSEYDGHTFPRTWQAHLRSKAGILDAGATYQAFADGVDGAGSFGRGLQTAFDALETEVERTRQDYDERRALLEPLSEGPYRHARFQLWQLTHGGLDVVHEDDLRTGLSALRTVRQARNVMRLRAYPDAVDRLPFEEGEEPTSANLYEEEKRAATRANELADEYDTPLFRLLIDDAVRLLRVADTGLTGSRAAENRPKARADAYAYYLVGNAQLRHAPDVYGELRAHLE